MTSDATLTLVLADADGALYAIPRELLAACRLTEEQVAELKSESEVSGYLIALLTPAPQNFTVLGSAYGSGGGAGKGNVQDFHFTKFVDKASPQLFS